MPRMVLQPIKSRVFVLGFFCREPCRRLGIDEQSAQVCVQHHPALTVDFPDPDTPVTTTSRPKGMATSVLETLCKLHFLQLEMARVIITRAQRLRRCCNNGSRRNLPVVSVGSGSNHRPVPAPTTSPPRTPACGPRSST